MTHQRNHNESTLANQAKDVVADTKALWYDNSDLNCNTVVGSQVTSLQSKLLRNLWAFHCS